MDPRGTAVGTVLKPLISDIAYECRRAGAVGLTVAYQFLSPNIAPVELSLTKECGQRPRLGLNLGTSASRHSNIVHNGVSRWPTESSMQRIIPASRNTVDLFWTLSSTGGQDDTAGQMIAPPRVTVTPLTLKLVPDGPLPPTEAVRWRRRLAGKAAREVNEQRRGLWGLDAAPASLADGRPIPEVATVRLVGALQEGGALPAAASLSAGTPTPKLRMKMECVRKGAALIEVEIAPFPAYQPYRPTVLSFVKRCGGVVKEGFDVASHMLVPAPVTPNLIKSGIPMTDNNFAGEVQNLQSTFSFYWRLTDHHP